MPLKKTDQEDFETSARVNVCAFILQLETLSLPSRIIYMDKFPYSHNSRKVRMQIFFIYPFIF